MSGESDGGDGCVDQLTFLPAGFASSISCTMMSNRFCTSDPGAGAELPPFQGIAAADADMRRADRRERREEDQEESPGIGINQAINQQAMDER